MLKKDNLDTNIPTLEFTGERYTPEYAGDIELKHVHRYILALQLVKDKVVLDIACGEGYGSSILSKSAKFVYGVDIDQNTITHAKKRYNVDNIEFRVGPAHKIPIDDSSIDVVVSFETIEHHEKQEEMLQEIKRVLKPEGQFIISSPNKAECIDKTGPGNTYHVKELYRSDLIALITRYFSNYKVYCQKLVYSSLILPEDGNTQMFSYHVNDKKHVKNISIPSPLIYIVVASDIHVNDLECSFFERPVDDLEPIVTLKKVIKEQLDALTDYKDKIDSILETYAVPK